MKNFNFLFSQIFFLFLFSFSSSWAQKPYSPEEISNHIKFLKEDLRGTYKNIRWFCNDGTIRDPKDPCPEEIGGIQHANYKDIVVQIANRNHLFFGEILSFTDAESFWDSKNNYSRLKQYSLGKYLANVDQGWVNKRGQYYRGAVQIEDEQAWGMEFFKWILKDQKRINENYFLIFQSLKDIPFKGDTDISLKMRAESKMIADEYSKFMDLRIKIHSNPTPDDIPLTQEFLDKNKLNLNENQIVLIESLISTLITYHKPVDLKEVSILAKSLSKDCVLKQATNSYLAFNSESNDPASSTQSAASFMLAIRMGIASEKKVEDRMKLLMIAYLLDQIIKKEAVLWETSTLDEHLTKLFSLSQAAVGSGCIELWEWGKVIENLKPDIESDISLAELSTTLNGYRAFVEWSSAMVKTHYEEEVQRFGIFEDKTFGFIDDRIRSTIALQLGIAVEELSVFVSGNSALTNDILNIPNQSSIRGLNPGFAYGELVVVNEGEEDINFSSDKIYVFNRAPSDLKPVAGIATVSEGNPVSHVQLLARNLGIPNMILSDGNIKTLQEYNGKSIFYAVSPKGNVIMKSEDNMTEEERKLFSKKVRKEGKIAVPIQQIRLDQRDILNLSDVSAKDSGKTCGPKAANLGELKTLFPENVVNGFVIPFGIFRDHLDQEMPGESLSYWMFLNNMFEKADSMEANNFDQTSIETYQLQQLAILRDAIKKMSFLPGFEKNIEEAFINYLGSSIGNTPVFLRSDTNMEDLKDFTGAGLNLTVFNTLSREKILQGIKDVWASPYSERSYKWRQKYLLNPENVFPSILVIPSVDVDYSGVIITKGISSGAYDDLTVAFNRGAGGAVDGQSSESYLIHQDGTSDLLSPSREVYYNKLPKSGGTSRETAALNEGILNQANIYEILNLTNYVERINREKGLTDDQDAFDIELGFKDNQLWLFQIRPFVENKNALGSNYLESITPSVDLDMIISLTSKMSIN